MHYSQVNPNTSTAYGVPDGSPTGSSQGLKNLINGSVEIAATSHPSPVVKQFIEFALSSQGQQLGQSLGFIQLRG